MAMLGSQKKMVRYLLYQVVIVSLKALNVSLVSFVCRKTKQKRSANLLVLVLFNFFSFSVFVQSLVLFSIRIMSMICLFLFCFHTNKSHMVELNALKH